MSDADAMDNAAAAATEWTPDQIRWVGLVHLIADRGDNGVPISVEEAEQRTRNLINSPEVQAQYAAEMAEKQAVIDRAAQADAVEAQARQDVRDAVNLIQAALSQLDIHMPPDTAPPVQGEPPVRGQTPTPP